MRNENVGAIVLAIFGLLIAAVGLISVIRLPDPQGVMRTLPYVLVGVGCGAFGHNLAEFIEKKALEKNPGQARRVEIEQKDERNLAIGNKSKAKAFDIMLYVYAAMMLTFALAFVDMMVIVVLVGSYLLVICTWIYFVWKYDREM